MSDSPDTPAAREYPDRPWVGVGVVIWRGERLLMIRRGRAPRIGQWSLPGGAQHVGETVFEAAVREAKEETGLDIVPTGIVTVVDSIVPDDAGRIHYHYTLVEVSAESGAGDLVAGDDASEVRWMSVEEAGAVTPWDETRRVIALSAAQRGRR